MAGMAGSTATLRLDAIDARIATHVLRNGGGTTPAHTGAMPSRRRLHAATRAAPKLTKRQDDVSGSWLAETIFL
jgi:hypothetical protein